MYIEALLDFYSKKAERRTLRVDEESKIDELGTSINRWDNKHTEPKIGEEKLWSSKEHHTRQL